MSLRPCPSVSLSVIQHIVLVIGNVSSWSCLVQEDDARTDQADSPIFTLPKLPWKDGEIDSEDGDDGHQHHRRPIHR